MSSLKLLYRITTSIYDHSPAFTVQDGLQRPVLSCSLPGLVTIASVAVHDSINTYPDYTVRLITIRLR